MANLATKIGWQETGVKTIKWYTAQDGNVCDFCKELDGKIISIENNFFNKGDTAQTEWQFVFNLAGGTVNFPTNLTTLMNTALGAVFTANQYVKLGFLFDPSALTAFVGASPTARQTQGQLARKVIRIFVNGVELPTFLSNLDVYNATAAQAFPTGFMSPVFGCQQHATKGLFKADWMRVAQMPNS